jgi:regulator of protease activity HflC (stomatin/prohibitin superfamily)
MTILLLAVAALVVVLIAMGVTVVQQAETVVIERLGRYHRTLDSGINVIIPMIDRPRQIQWRVSGETSSDGQAIYRKHTAKRIDLREQLYDFPRQNVITRDNVATEINAMVYFQVTDPARAVYEIADLPNAIEKLTQTSLRNVVGEMDLDELLSSRDKVNSSLRTILDEATDKWGVKVNRVEIQDINPPPDIRQAMEKQMRAERDKRAAVLTAEASKQSAILEAEGVSEAQVTRARGEQQARIMEAEAEAQARARVAQAEAQAIRMITDSLGGTGVNPSSYLVAMRYIDALKGLGEGNAEKIVYLPYEATSIMASLGGIRDLFGATGEQKPAAPRADGRPEMRRLPEPAPVFPMPHAVADPVKAE